MVNNDTEKAKKIMIDFVNGRLIVVESPKDEFNLIKYLKHKEMENLIGTVSEDKTPNSVRDITILLLILECGFRKSSLLNAKWQDIDIMEKSILVNYWNRENSYYVELNDQLIIYLNRLRNNILNPCTYIFGGITGRAMSKNQIEKIIGRLSAYTSYSKSAFYCVLRNTFIINCLEKSENVNQFFKLTGFSEKNQIGDYVRSFEFDNGFLTGFLD